MQKNCFFNFFYRFLAKSANFVKKTDFSSKNNSQKTFVRAVSSDRIIERNPFSGGNLNVKSD